MRWINRLRGRVAPAAVQKGRAIWDLIKETVEEWQKDNAMTLAAALSFYTIFSMAPLLFIVLVVGTFVLGESEAQTEILRYLRRLLGAGNAQLILTLSQRAQEQYSNLRATLVGVLTLLFGATVVFAELRSALNTTWNVVPKPGSSWTISFLRTRLLAFAMVLGVGSLLVLSLMASAFLSALNRFLGGAELPLPPLVMQSINFGISFVMITVGFALIYKILPDARIRWSDVWVGAAITSLLFTCGKSLIGMYVGRSLLGSVYGAAGSLVLILLWVYYSAQVFLFGAELTQIYARKHGLQIEPTENATRMTIHIEDG
ncbi:MAG: YihY/virulence factor BrkB family protein [Acidobacteriota bacterium]